jgi:hypothetical protein
VSDLAVLRPRFVVGERAFAVVGDAWFDRDAGEWRGRALFLPLDRSLPRGVASEALGRGVRRADVERRLRRVTDRALLAAFRAIPLPLPRRPRGR